MKPEISLKIELFSQKPKFPGGCPMKSYGIAGQVFLLLALLGWIGWLATRFSGPVFGVSYEGFYLFTAACLFFAIAISLVKLAFAGRGDKTEKL
jgi:hypothetical protein